MAKIASSFQCMICKERCAFPNDSSIVQFQIIFLQFYQAHDDEKKCQAKVDEMKKLFEESQPKPKKGKNANRST